MKQEIPIIAVATIIPAIATSAAAAAIGPPSKSKTSNSTAGGSSSNNTTDETITKKRRIMKSNYVRIMHDSVWPIQEKYELADDDVIFLNDLNASASNSHPHPSTTVLAQADMEYLIETFELKSGKDFITTWMDVKDLIEHRITLSYPQNILEKIYNYWRIKRDALKRPLLRYLAGWTFLIVTQQPPCCLPPPDFTGSRTSTTKILT